MENAPTSSELYSSRIKMLILKSDRRNDSGKGTSKKLPIEQHVISTYYVDCYCR